MTITAPPPPAADSNTQLWSTMPGWGIAANLLPPEVIAGRRLTAIRKIIGAILVVLVAGAGAGYAYAIFQQRSAQAALTAEQANTSSLLAAQQKYSDVVTLNAAIQQVKGQLATLLQGDVDTVKLIDALESRLPNGASLTQVQVSLLAAGAQVSTSGSSSSASAGGGGGALDASGQTHIGTVNLTGAARSLSDVAGYLNQLATLPGVVGVFPTSQQKAATGKGTQFTIQMTLTDDLLTHRYDVAANATAPTGGK